MFRFVLLIFLFFGSYTAFASDNVSKPSIADRLKKIVDEKNLITFPNKPFGIEMGMPLNEKKVTIYYTKKRDFASLIEILPDKTNSNFSNYWVGVSLHNNNIFQVTALSKARYKTTDDCLPHRDALHKRLFRKYERGSKQINVSTGLAFKTTGKIDGQVAHFQVSLNCIRDITEDFRLELTYLDVLLSEESFETYKSSLASDINNL